MLSRRGSAFECRPEPGRIPRSLSDDLKFLNELRIIGDYGEMQHVPEKEAAGAIAAAKRLVEALRKLR